jgi:hypothetical protein
MEKWFTHYSERQFLFLNDLILAPVFIFIIYQFSKGYIRNKKNPVYQKYFLPALYIRFISAIAMALMYQYYYDGGGDTNTYFTYVQRIRMVSHESFTDFINIAFGSVHDPFVILKYFGVGSDFYFNPSSNVIIKIALYCSYPLLNSYILISFAFTIFCFYGCWKIFILFSEIYPHLEKEFALACLFLPSVCFWGTGILKDPICLGALGALTYHIYKLFFERTKIIRRTILIVLCFFLLKTLKVYIILSFMPAYTFWIFFRYKTTIQSNIIKSFMSPVLFVISGAIGILVFIKIAQFSERYAFENLVRTAKDTQNWIYTTSQYGGSGYTLGNIDYTPVGLLKVFPKAVNVALFRPYLWEARKPILVPAALEGLISLFFTIRLLYKAGFIRFTKLIITNPEVQFCLIFSLMFAFSVGFTSYNFGSLVRYKIPLMPFYYIALFILADREKVPEKMKGTKSPAPKPIKALVPA